MLKFLPNRFIYWFMHKTRPQWQLGEDAFHYKKDNQALRSDYYDLERQYMNLKDLNRELVTAVEIAVKFMPARVEIDTERERVCNILRKAKGK